MPTSSLAPGRMLLALVASVAVIGLVACGETTSTTTKVKGTQETRTTSTEAAAGAASAVSVRDAWVQAAERGQTSVFGVLVNTGDHDLTVTAAVADASPFVELRETVAGADGAPVVGPKAGGFVIPAGGEHPLQPGGDHLMLSTLTRALRVGDRVSIALTVDDGSTVDVTAVVSDGGLPPVAAAPDAAVLGATTTPGSPPGSAATNPGGAGAAPGRTPTTAPRSTPTPTAPTASPGPTAGPTPTTVPTTASPTTAPPSAGRDADLLSIRDVWVLPADAGRMSAVYGVMTNSGGRVITVVSSTSEVSRMELHETIPLPGGGTTMRPKAGGFPIAPGAQYTLRPGGDHVMLMGVSRQIVVGETLRFTLVLADGSTFAFSAPVRN